MNIVHGKIIRFLIFLFFFLNKNNPVLKCKFKYDIILDDTAKEDLEDVKKTIATNEKSIKKVIVEIMNFMSIL